jgi:opacity protein-like surface antigen
MKGFLTVLAAPMLAAAAVPTFYAGAGMSFSEIGWKFFENEEVIIPHDVIPASNWSVKVMGGVEYRSRYAFEIFFSQARERTVKRHAYQEDEFGNVAVYDVEMTESFSQFGANAIYYIGGLEGLRAYLFARFGMIDLKCDYNDGETVVDIGVSSIGYGGGLGLEYRLTERLSARMEWSAQKLSTSRAAALGETSMLLKYRL